MQYGRSQDYNNNDELGFATKKLVNISIVLNSAISINCNNATEPTSRCEGYICEWIASKTKGETYLEREKKFTQCILH